MNNTRKGGGLELHLVWSSNFQEPVADLCACVGSGYAIYHGPSACVLLLLVKML